MSYRRISEHSFDIVLHDGYHVADAHREGGHDGERAQPALVSVTACARHRSRDRKSKNEDAHERGEAGSLWTGSHEGSDRSGCAFINIGCPDVKRSRGDLETETHQQH